MQTSTTTAVQKKISSFFYLIYLNVGVGIINKQNKIVRFIKFPANPIAIFYLLLSCLFVTDF